MKRNLWLGVRNAVNSAADWFACTNPDTLLEFTQGLVSERKYRLFAIACCRRIWHLIADEPTRRLVEVVERHIEGQASDKEWREATNVFHEARRTNLSVHSSEEYMAALVGQGLLTGEHAHIFTETYTRLAAWELRHPQATPHIQATPGHEGRAVAHLVARYTASSLHPEVLHGQDCFWNSPERPIQCDLLRDILGNPFGRPAVPQTVLAWSDGVVLKMAHKIYEEGTFDLMPIMADALQDAGCSDDAVLKHCRQSGEHVRGCWVVDLLCKNDRLSRKTKTHRP